MLVSEWIAKHNVTATFKSHGKRVTDGWEHTYYTATVTNENDYAVTFPFKAGTEFGKPVPADIFECLASDARVFEEHSNPYDVMSTFGMEDYASAEDLYDACNETATTLYDWCVSPDMYTELLTSEEG